MFQSLRHAGLLLGQLALVFAVSPAANSAEVFVEAESFPDRGGWKLDTQFIQQMGSPYLLAHGLGRPVEDTAPRECLSLVAAVAGTRTGRRLFDVDVFAHG